MADVEMRDVASDDTSDSATDSNASDTDLEQVETLVAGRQKRATAANRYDRERLVQEAEEDALNDQDEVNLLFADIGNEEDEEFAGSDEDEGDAELDSSSDEDDRGPNAQGDELDGERQLQQEAKAERTKKRKARLELTTAVGLRKKVRIDPRLPSGGSTTPKPTKKKERSFLLIDAEGRSRASLRTSTVANKEETQARLIEEEKLRVKLRAKKEKKERERARDEPPIMTQADRLAEAERMERRNAKSLSRWETMEKKRTEEQAAKIAALKNRKLDGPVVTWWSGVAKWVGPKLNQVGIKEPTQEAGLETKKRGRKSKAYHEQMAAASQREAEESATVIPQDTPTDSATGEKSNPSEETSEAITEAVTAPAPITFAIPQGPDNFLLQGIHEFASLPPDVPPMPSAEVSNSKPDQETADKAAAATEADPILSEIHPPMVLPPVEASLVPSQPPEPPKIEHATRNLVVLKDFDELAPRHRGNYGVFYNTRKSGRPTRHSAEMCPITGLPARYRDPLTGIPYANTYAYRKLQELKKYEHTWSGMLGCYVGRAGVVARGVPEGFPGTI